MSFSFGFTKDDFSDDDDLDESSQIQPTAEPTDQNQSQKSALDSLQLTPENLPKEHSLDSLLSSLQNVRITFDSYTTTGGNVIYRRELFDVKHQIMTEDDRDNAQLSELLIDENNNDLQKNVYEGGFKSWECSYDTVDKLAGLIDNGQLTSNSVMEFGCGTALPSCFILLKKLQLENRQPLKLILSDFNFDVLRLVTLPNILTHWASTLPVEKLHSLVTSEDNPRFNNDELFLTSQLLEQFKADLAGFNIDLKFISGGWGNEFNQLVANDAIDFIISSETIYSPESLPIVAESIKEILLGSLAKSSMALVAAKNIYFGVGGSLIEFINYFNSIKTKEFEVDVEEINDAQLKRSLVYIRYNK
ncbi:Histidine protein methyltransferase 1 [Candida viswanathii]|uniref:protein-histidine N-methyltransferase n=1 Tax=Candida viswanathii TaxID=5486 RepID=A0A367Y5D4_9ASCO|nr:Histidine protein methyltransferase 1 [Candida viswanathii]